MTPDFFRARLGEMVNHEDPLDILSRQMPWDEIEAYLSQFFVRQLKPGTVAEVDDLFGTHTQCLRSEVSPAGRNRLMASLLYLAYRDNHSDESVVQRWSESVPYSALQRRGRGLCDASQTYRFRQAIGEDGVEYLMHITVRFAVAIHAIPVEALQSLIVDSTVREKAIAHPTDSRLLEVARYQIIKAAQRVGFRLNQTFAQEARALRRRAGGYAHARQFKRLHKVLRRQRTIVGIVRVIFSVNGSAGRTVLTRQGWIPSLSGLNVCGPSIPKTRTSCMPCMHRKLSARPKARPGHPTNLA